MFVHDRLLLPNLGREGAAFMVRVFGSWTHGSSAFTVSSAGKDGSLLTCSLHVQDWVVEHGEKMPHYGEGSTLAAMLPWLLSMVQHVHL